MLPPAWRPRKVWEDDRMSFRPPQKPTPDKNFTTFCSAVEESIANAEPTSLDKEGGHMSSTCGRAVRTPNARFPYKVILTHPGQADSARAFDSMRDAEAFIRRNTPVPAARSTLYDRDAGDS
jgi:hypothetical protein